MLRYMLSIFLADDTVSHHSTINLTKSEANDFYLTVHESHIFNPQKIGVSHVYYSRHVEEAVCEWLCSDSGTGKPKHKIKALSKSTN